MIPRFSRTGFLPPGLHAALWPEIAERFGEPKLGTNARRARLMRGLARALSELARAGCTLAYLDGSFVSRERWPKDFDVCYELEPVRIEELDRILRDFSTRRTSQKAKYGGEILPRDFPFSWNSETVFQAFQRTRADNERKGMISIDLQINLGAIEQWLEAQGEASDGL